MAAVGTMNPPAKTKLLSFFELPFDVREKALWQLYPSANIRVFLPRRGSEKPTPIELPATARAGSQKLRLETIRAGLMNGVVEVHSFVANGKFQDWLADLDLSQLDSKNQKNGFDAIKQLSFPYFSRFPHHSMSNDRPNSDLELAKKCFNLRELTLDFHEQEVELDIWEDTHKSPDLLVPAYRLDQVFALGKLEKLNFTVTGYTTKTNAGVEELVTWFTEQFESRGRKVKVEYLRE